MTLVPLPQLRLKPSSARQGGGVVFIQKQTGLLTEDSGCETYIVLKIQEPIGMVLAVGHAWSHPALPSPGCCCLSAAYANSLP